MKKKMLLGILTGAAVAAGTGVAIYLLRKRRNKNSLKEAPGRKRERHFTKAFAKAKQFADADGETQ